MKTQDVLPENIDGWSREHLVEILTLETAENHRLRTVLLELASRSEITADTRRWLAGKIKERGKEPIVRGLREEEMELVRGLHKWAGKLADVAQSVSKEEPCGGIRAPRADIEYGQLESYAEQVQHFLQECNQQFGRTIQDLEEAR